ncbi:U2 snRNP-associated protein Uap2 [Schizosaccharomyces cryophilus OY26]|uniref:U2 snRNP-associated protein Uap2 n=1 Tax=Schizosaccharomyces cryophilus (strain OY26 / ATCC MYA-4695 / CBS 11777 / NBRC 106824 / NRRL Y48691) TaxID=653667 RepID=S9VVL8_SCHCR|nr:U2 snRNP-associated protein Uap2 [Schizosaccharomyces cryophilus OY26]EPY50160.1 U2 snRNP-associated protein Uap2 [Schizosaccharomyces cryophilus OY26]
MSSQPVWDAQLRRWRCLGPQEQELVYIDEEKSWKEYDFENKKFLGSFPVESNTDEDSAQRSVEEKSESITEKKREHSENSSSEEQQPNASVKRTRKEETSSSKNEIPAPINKAIYVSGLPKDVTISEVNEVFSKCGIIAENVDTGTPRIKLYTNDDGTLKGDALIVFFRSESIELAEQLFDDTEFRFGTGVKMKVQEASIDYKKEKSINRDVSDSVKKKVQRKRQQQLQKISSWGEVEEEIDEKRRKRFGKILVLKHIFTLDELDAQPELLLDLKEDITAEAEKCGRVTNVVLYDQEPEGVVTIRFSTNEEAEECMRLMQGRYFDGRIVEASIYDGKTRYRKSGKQSFEDDEEEEHRLERFASWLENGEKNDQ